MIEITNAEKYEGLSVGAQLIVKDVDLDNGIYSCIDPDNCDKAYIIHFDDAVEIIPIPVQK